MKSTPRQPRIAYIGAHLPSYYAAEYQVFATARAALQKMTDELDCVLIDGGPPLTSAQDARKCCERLQGEAIDFVLLHCGAFTMGDVAREFAARGFRIGLWATPEPTHSGPILLNNLVAMHLQAGVLARWPSGAGIPSDPSRRPPAVSTALAPADYKWFLGAPDGDWFRPRLHTTVRALRALVNLRGSRIALVGDVAPSFLNMIVDERELLDRFGVECRRHELGELFARVEQADEQECRAAMEAMRRAAKVEINAHDFRRSAAIYVALRTLARDGNYSALAVSDWPLFQERLQIHPGMAFSWLDEADAIPVAAEGDVTGALTMLLMRWISGGPAMLLDMNDLDRTRDALLMWHCGGSPLGLADENGVRWTNHSTLARKEHGRPTMGAVADFRFAPAPATIARVSADCRRLFVGEAQIITGEHSGFDGCRGWFNNFHIAGQALTLADWLNTILVEGVEHHCVVGRGHYQSAWDELALRLALPITTARPYSDAQQIATP